MFDDASIVENCIAFIFAAIETSQYTSQNLISHLTQSKESLKKVRLEFSEQVLKPALEEDASLASLPKRELLDKVLTLETAQDLEYMTMVMMEALRFRPAAPNSEFYTPKKTVKLGKYTF